MDTELVSVVIVNWNGMRWLERCLSSLTQQTYTNIEIIFVDNNSTDGSVEYVQKNFTSVVIKLNTSNLGFGTASNMGAALSRGEILFFLNNDTVLFPGTLEILVKYKKENSLNLLSPNILDANGTSLPIGVYGSGMDILGTPKGLSKKLFYIDGCALLVGKKDFNTIGCFDEKYFMYGEDVDLSWRARLLGMKLGVCMESRIIHYGGGSSESTRHEKHEKHGVPVLRRYEAEKNHLRNLLKNYGFTNVVWAVPVYVLQQAMEIILYAGTGNFKMVKVLSKAIFWNMKNMKDTLTKRRHIQKNRVVGDRKIMKVMYFGVHKVSIFFQMGIPKFK